MSNKSAYQQTRFTEECIRNILNLVFLCASMLVTIYCGVDTYPKQQTLHCCRSCNEQNSELLCKCCTKMGCCLKLLYWLHASPELLSCWICFHFCHVTINGNCKCVQVLHTLKYLCSNKIWLTDYVT